LEIGRCAADHIGREGTARYVEARRDAVDRADIVAGGRSEQLVAPGNDLLPRRRGEAPVHIVAGGEHDFAILDRGARRRSVADRAAEQGGDRLVLRNGDHVDLLDVLRARAGGPAGRAVVDQRVGRGAAAGLYADVEEAVVDRELSRFRCDIGDGAIHLHRPVLLDPRRHDRHVAAARLGAYLCSFLDDNGRVGADRSVETVAVSVDEEVAGFGIESGLIVVIRRLPMLKTALLPTMKPFGV
jgi:hypothetical protein